MNAPSYGQQHASNPPYNQAPNPYGAQQGNSYGGQQSPNPYGTCLCCLKLVEGSLRCSKCRTALYCGRACQLKHWPVHKNNCRDSNDTENSDDKPSTRFQNQVTNSMNLYNQGNIMHIYESVIIINYHC